MGDPRSFPFTSATWTSPWLDRGAARLSALLALVPLLDLLFASTRSALKLTWSTGPLTAEHDAALFFGAALLALVSGKLGSLAGSRLRSGVLHLDDEGITITSAGHERRIPLGSIEQGLLTASDKGAALILHLRRGTHLTLALETEEDAEAALAALSLGPDKKRFTMTSAAGRALLMGCVGIGLGPLLVMLAWAFMPAVWLQSQVFGPLMCVLSITLMLLFGRLSWPEVVTIGADGIGIQGRFRDRFIPYDRLLSASHLSSTAGLVLTLAAPARRPRTRAREPELVVVDGFRAEVLAGAVRRIQAAKDAFADVGSSLTLGALDPEGKRLDTWIAGLGALAREAGSSYRRPSVSVESLVDIVSRPDTASGLRIGAAIALKGSGHEGAAERIRIAADGMASEALRAVLLDIAAEEEANLALIEVALRRTR